MTARKLTSDDIVTASKVQGSPTFQYRVRYYGHLKELSCVNHIIWVDENFNETVVKTQMALELHRKLVKHLKIVEKYCA